MINQLSEQVGKSLKLQGLIAFLVSLFILTLVHQLSVLNTHNDYYSQIKSTILQRIALDLPTIPVEKHWLNEAGDEQEVNNYRVTLNNSIKVNEWPISVTYIGTQKPTNAKYEILSAVEQSVYVTFDYKELGFWHSISITPILFSALLTWIVVFRRHAKEQMKPVEQRLNASPLILTIDLRSKLLINARSGKETALSNKPLCFYCALIDFCIANPDLNLNMNKDLPEEFLILSQKYFYRLIELGHTIRKRPNFESNLDKTLSEIRAALEDVLEQDVLSKEKLIPPKAIGEGSRSKLHNFGLSDISQDIVEIVGK